MYTSTNILKKYQKFEKLIKYHENPVAKYRIILYKCTNNVKQYNNSKKNEKYQKIR